MPDVSFDEALEAAVAAIEAAGVDLERAEATLLRDLHGRLRLYVVFKDDRCLNNKDEKKLAAALASVTPYGTRAVHVDRREAPFALKEIVERDRHPLELDRAPGPRCPRWFRFERRLSKDAWLDETGEDRQPWPQDTAPLVVSFYGFKGGVGRTTALAAFALHLAGTGRDVAVIDLDLEAPGIAALLTGGEEPDLGVLDFLIEEQLEREPRLPLSRFYLQSPYVSAAAGVAQVGALRVFPAGRLDRSYIEKLGRIDLQGTVDPQHGVRTLLLRLLERIRAELRPDAILLDVRAGLHDLGGLSLAGLSHLELLFAVHSSQTWAGLPLVLRHLGRLRAPWVKLVHALVPPRQRGGEEAHEAFVQQAYDVCRECYYPKRAIPDLADQAAAHWAYRLPYREALMGLSDLGVAKSDLLSDEHRIFCEQLALACGWGRHGG